MTKENTIAISGASGFVGSYLSNYFASLGYKILPLTRQLFLESAEDQLSDQLSKANVVINLAGAPINKRWTQSYKKELHDSRVLVTQKIVNSINSLAIKPKLLISASAIGYYAANGRYSEYNAEQGIGFLAQLCNDWEQEAQKIDTSVRLVSARLSVVLDTQGGAFEQMLFPCKFRLAAVIGDKEQKFSWIDIADLAEAFRFIIENPSLHGVVNLSSPQSITNQEMLDMIARHWKSWFKLRIPSRIVRLVLGESAEFITQSLDIVPQKLLEAGFQYQSPQFEEFCRRIKQ